MITPLDENRYDEDDLQAAKAMKGLVDYGLEPADLAFYVEHTAAIVEEKMRLMIGKVMAGRSLDEMDTVALHVEELGDALRHVLHARVLRRAAQRLSDEFKSQFGGSK